MAENLRFRIIVVIALTLACIAVIAKPLVYDPLVHGKERKSPLTLGLDIRGGVNLRYEFATSGDSKTMREKVATAQQIFSSRLDNLAIREISVRPIGENQIEVAVPGVSASEADAITATLESMGRLEFRLQAWTDLGVDPTVERNHLAEAITTRKEAGQEITPDTDFSALTQGLTLEGEGEGITFRWVPIGPKLLKEMATKGTAAMTPEQLRWDTPDAWQLMRFDNREGQHFTGNDVADVHPTTDPDNGLPAVGFVIKEGRPAQQFADFTEQNIGRGLTILLDNQIQTIANIESRIPGSGMINGGSDGFSQEELTRLISVIRSGSLPEKPTLVSRFTQGPNLGEDAIRRGIYATLTTFLLVAGFMLIYYRLAGVVSITSLVCNLILLVAAMSLLDATLTLPGVAGYMLTIGMAVDANILITERIREELDKGKTLVQAVKNGYDRAWSTIFDSNLTTLFAGFFLYRFGTGAIRGFAVSLMIGLATSMLTGVYFSRTFFDSMLVRGLKQVSMLRFMARPNFKFLNNMKACYTISTVLIVSGIAVFLWLPKQKLGMDFTGGFEAQITLRQPHGQEEVRATVATVLPGAEVVSIDSGADGKAVNFQVKEKEAALSGINTATPAGGSEQQALVDSFAAKIRGIFGDRLEPQPIHAIQLAPPDEQGRVVVECDATWPRAVRRIDLQNALARVLTLAGTDAITAVGAPDGAENATTFHVKGSFARAPAGEQEARGRIAAAAKQLPAADGSGNVRMTEPLTVSYVGPRAGEELRDSAIQAMFFTLLMIVIYVRMRFRQYRFGIAAVVALIHDVAMTLAVVGIAQALGLEIELDLTMVAAFLTIIGFSINDTIVIFDRIRENLPRSSLPLRALVDLSVNQTLSRTILTSLTVLVSMVILFCFNVGQKNALSGFAFSMIVGVITGSYSTIWIASALTVNISDWYEKKKTGKGGGAAPPQVRAAASA